MKRNNWRGRVILVIGFLCFPLFGMSQNKTPKPPNRKQQERAEAKSEKDLIKAQKRAKKAYRNRQSSKTKKSMKQNKKKSDRNRASKPEPFWKRWFKRGW